MVRGPRYMVGYSHRRRAYGIWDCWMGAPCGLPDEDGEIQRLSFMDGGEAHHWLIKCHDAGLPLGLDIPVETPEEARDLFSHLKKGGFWGPWVLVAEPVAA